MDFGKTLLRAVVLALAADGPGRPSIDAALLPRFKGPGWALLALSAGVGGSLLATSDRLGEVTMPRQEDQITFAGEPVGVNGARSGERTVARS